MPALIQEVVPGSIAAEVGLEPGDTLCSINGKTVADILDFQFASADAVLEMEVKKADGQSWLVDIEKDEDEPLGLVLEGFIFDSMKVCTNRCVFCFVDQLPPGLRSTLKVKDDDYRHSFLFGNFITLTNLKAADWDKIAAMRLSPLYISVHAMQPEVRAKMLHNKKGRDIKEGLERLCRAGIEMHTQIVLCPGINDGLVLEDSIEQLAGFYPCLQSIGIVPVGLSGHRLDLPELRRVDPEQSGALIRLVDKYQEKYRRDYGTGLVYLADEFYLQADIAIPDSSYYDGFEQLENGIGLVRCFWDDFTQALPELPDKVSPREIFIITGVSGQAALQPVVERLNRIAGMVLHTIPIINGLLGESITVTGLLTGQDIIKTLGDNYRGKTLLLPEIVLKSEEDVLLDDISVAQIEKAAAVKIRVVPMQARDLIEAVLNNNSESGE